MATVNEVRHPKSVLMSRKLHVAKQGGDDRRKKRAMESLFADKALTTELIRLYSNNADLRESQKRLAIATGHKPPRGKHDV